MKVQNTLRITACAILGLVGSVAAQAQHYHRSTVVVRGDAPVVASSATSATWLSISASTIAAHHKAVEYVRVREDAAAVLGGESSVSAMLQVVMSEEKSALAQQMGADFANQASKSALAQLVMVKADVLSRSAPANSAPLMSAAERYAVAAERAELTKQFGSDAARFVDADVLEIVEIKGNIAK